MASWLNNQSRLNIKKSRGGKGGEMKRILIAGEKNDEDDGGVLLAHGFRLS